MSTSVEGDVTILPRRAERAFRVGAVIRRGSVTSAEMRGGAWLLAPDGVPSAGALGVLVDDVLGMAAVGERPSGSVSVSTEIAIDVVDPPTVADARLTCTGTSLRRDDAGGVARGEVLAGNGRCLAVATQQQRLVPGSFIEGAWNHTEPLTVDDERSPASLLDATFTPAPGVALRLPGGDDIANPAGTVHGGVSIWASDLVGRLALGTEAVPFSTSSLHIVYLRPLPASAPVVFDVDVVHAGRTFGVARVTGRTEGDDRPATVTTVTACRRTRA